MATNIDRVMEQIALLLARADHPNTPPAEAATSRERAEILMRRHRIEEANLSVEEKAIQGIRPVDMTWVVGPQDTDFINSYYNIAHYIARHVEAEYHGSWKRIDGEYVYTLHVFGFESDLRYGAMLLQAARAAFGEALEPTLDRSLSDEDNVYRMRSAGMERNRIARVLWGSAMDDGVAHGKVARLYKKACEARGEDVKVAGRTNNAKTYRKSYAEGFVNTLVSRLRQAAMAAGMEGTALVMANRREQVQEAFWAAYPQYRPAKAVDSSEKVSCGKCQKATSGYCREHSYRKPRAYKARPFNSTAYSTGSSAARKVDLGGTGGSLER